MIHLDSPIYKGTLKTHKETKELLLPRLLDNLEKSDRDRHYEGCDSFQTNLNENGQEDLLNELVPHINTYLEKLGYSQVTYKVNGWFNLYGSGQYQEEHSHLPMLFTGLYALAFDEKVHTPLHFINSSPAISALHEQLNLRPTNYPETLPSRKLDIKEGDIYIWSGDKRHRVPPQPKDLKDNYRVTFTFNVTI